MPFEDKIAKQIGHLTMEIFRRETVIEAQQSELVKRDMRIKELEAVIDAASEPTLPLTGRPRVLTDDDLAAAKDIGARIRDERSDEHINGGPH